MRYIEEGASRVGGGIEAGLWTVFGRAVHFEFSDPEYMKSPFYRRFSELIAERGWVHHNDSLDRSRHPTFGMIWEKGRGLKQLARASLETSGFYPGWAVIAGIYKFPEMINEDVFNLPEQDLNLTAVDPGKVDEVIDFGVDGVYKFPDVKKEDVYNLPDQGLYLPLVHPEKKDEVIDFGLEIMDDIDGIDRVLLRIRHSGKFIQISRDGAGHNIIDVFASEMEGDLGIPRVPKGWKPY